MFIDAELIVCIAEVLKLTLRNQTVNVTLLLLYFATNIMLKDETLSLSAHKLTPLPV